MAPLSHQLAGVVLDHEHFGSHLGSKGETIDINLEKQNFKYAGELLCQLWNELEIDKHPVNAVYVEPEENETINVEPQYDQTWYATHVRSSQYLLQIVKCKNELCCGSYRSNLRSILPHGFLPPPVKVKPSENGILEACNVNDKAGKFLPLFQQLASDIKAKTSGIAQVNSLISIKVFIKKKIFYNKLIQFL